MLRTIAIGCCLTAAAAAAELPVKKVALYKHGVGYFERAGELGPGESARLDFKAEEMNDVLKSLTLETGGNDRVVALRYDASDSLEKKIARFPVRLEPGQPLSRLLDQLKGERLELQFGAEAVTGAIVGARLSPGAEHRPEHEKITLLLDTDELVTRDLAAASSVRFTEPELQLLLKDYLAVLAGARSTEVRSVYIDSSDTGSRQVRASYMIPAPVWKSSYRLIFAEQGEPMLEGWAIVDNTTGSDWTNVSLALISGRPISFVSPLYEARYVERPVAELPEERPVGPDVHEGALEARAAPPPAPAQAKPAPKRMMEAEPQFRARAEGLGGVPQDVMAAPSTVASTAAARELGELFEYRFDRPVTVRKNESAMLPFLQQKIGARKLLIYSDLSSAHPRHAAEIANNTGKTLDGGPVTVFEGGAYGGEALMETLKSGDKRLISYGVDLGTRISTKFDSERARVREVHLRRGVLTENSAIRETRTYTVRNIDQKPKVLIVEHPVRPMFDLVGREPDEKTVNAYRFEMKLAAGATQQLPVTEERPLVNTVAVVNLTPDALLSYVENKELSDQVRERLSRILDQKRQIAEVDEQIQRVETEIRELGQDQERLRANISSLNRVSGQQEQVQKYAAQLAQQETRMAELRVRLSELRDRKTGLEKELNALIERMEF